MLIKIDLCKLQQFQNSTEKLWWIQERRYSRKRSVSGHQALEGATGGDWPDGGRGRGEVRVLHGHGDAQQPRRLPPRHRGLGQHQGRPLRPPPHLQQQAQLVLNLNYIEDQS